MPLPIPPALVETTTHDSYRRLEAVYSDLRQAHNHLRSNLSRLVPGEGGKAAPLGDEIGHLVKRIEDACFRYRMAARAFAETATPHIESAARTSGDDRARESRSEPGLKDERASARSLEEQPAGGGQPTDREYLAPRATPLTSKSGRQTEESSRARLFGPMPISRLPPSPNR